MAKKTPITKLDEAIKKVLDDYEGEISGNVDNITKKIGQKGAAALRQESAQKFNGNKYRKSWTSRYEQTRLASKVTLYSKMPGLPHLLENGHAKRGGGRTNPYEHIRPVEEWAIDEVIDRTITKVERQTR